MRAYLRGNVTGPRKMVRSAAGTGQPGPRPKTGQTKTGHPVPRRLGPRPLPIHLSTAIGVWCSSKTASQLLKSGSIAWQPDLRESAARLSRDLDRIDPAALQDALDREIGRRLDLFTRGLTAYRAHPHRRRTAEPEIVARIGSTRLLRYPPERTADQPSAARRHEGLPPLLLVPSLINRAYILDLGPDRSFARWLAGQGFEVLLVDWGGPGETERRFTLDDYILSRLVPFAAQATSTAGRRPVLVGYCMGGLLALALALHRPDLQAGLAVLATPWDFHAQDGTSMETRGATSIDSHRARMAALVERLDPILSVLDVLPVDAIQALFAIRDPLAVARKFSAFARLPSDSLRAREFVELEDWLNDGVPLAGPVARECLIGWYGENRPCRGLWSVAGVPVVPQQLQAPLLCLVPAQDRIVPPASAAALAEAVPGCERASPPVGHIGMMTGREAARFVWQPLVDWILTHC